MRTNLPCFGAITLLLLCPSLAVAAAFPLATIPVSVMRSRIMVPVSLNGSNGLSFMLDTGFSLTMVNPALTGPLQLRRAGEITIAGIAGDEKAVTYEGAIFGIGGVTYQPRRVAALSSESNHRRRRDGILGSGLFRQFVVELDSLTPQLRLYAPANYAYEGRGEVLPLRFASTTPVIKATIYRTNGTAVQAEFEIDTGCDSGLCLGHDFIKTHQLLNQADTREGGKYGVGGGTETRTGHLPQLQMGHLKIDRPQTDFFLEGSPVDQKFAGHIGMGVLKHFKVIFDYSRKQMILEPPVVR